MIQTCDLKIENIETGQTCKLMLIRITEDEPLFVVLTTQSEEAVGKILYRYCKTTGQSEAVSILLDNFVYIASIPNGVTIEQEELYDLVEHLSANVPEFAWVQIDTEGLYPKNMILPQKDYPCPNFYSHFALQDKVHYYRVKNLSDLFAYSVTGTLYEDGAGYILKSKMVLNDFFDEVDSSESLSKPMIEDVSMLYEKKGDSI